MAKRSRAAYLEGVKDIEALATIASGKNPDGTDFELAVTGGSEGGGDASAANQLLGNTSLDNIDDKTPALGQALAAASTPVVLTAIQIASLVSKAGAANIATGQVATSTGAGTAVIARATRRKVTLINMDSSIVMYVGPATVSAANGFRLVAGAAMDITWVGLIQVIAASGTPTLGYADEYD